ncbi:MAG: adenylate/guanylate cyclase domain-containing protein, partial [Ramlibacter sp.]
IDEPLALSHAYLSRFLRAMVQAQPRVIGLDLVLPEKRFQSLAPVGQPGQDYHKILLSALLTTSRDVPIVTANVWDAARGHFRDIQLDYATALAMQERGLATRASALFCHDPDGRVRRYPGSDCQPGGTNITFASEVGAAMGVRQKWSGFVNYRLGTPFAYVPIQHVLKLAANDDTEALQRLFKGRAVLLGTVLDDIDLLPLPIPLAVWRPGDERAPGVVAHAQVLRSMLNGGFIQPVPWWLLVPATAVFALFWLGAALMRKFVLFAAVATGVLWLSYELLESGVWLAPGAMLLTGLAACIGRGALEGWRNWREKRRLSDTFSGYVSPEVMREIVAGGVAADQQGRKVTVCVLFSDIRGFTTLSEHAPAEEVVALLNRYFARMTAAVHHHGGTVDKFIGDGLMAFFGAPNKLANPSRNALDASHEMLAELAALNVELAAEGRAPLAIGIGLQTGEAVIGHIGSPERHAYTAIGDTVNTAARLEGLCKDLGCPIVCTEIVAQAVGPAAGLVALGAQPLKGRSAIPVYGWLPPAQNVEKSNADAAGDAMMGRVLDPAPLQ